MFLQSWFKFNSVAFLAHKICLTSKVAFKRYYSAWILIEGEIRLLQEAINISVFIKQGSFLVSLLQSLTKGGTNFFPKWLSFNYGEESKRENHRIFIFLEKKDVSRRKLWVTETFPFLFQTSNGIYWYQVSLESFYTFNVSQVPYLSIRDIIVLRDCMLPLRWIHSCCFAK